MKKKKRKVREHKPIYIINTKIGPTKCLNCGKKKIVYFYEVKNRYKKEADFTLVMCKECLEELKFNLKESHEPSKRAFYENVLTIIDDMFLKNIKENENEREKFSL